MEERQHESLECVRMYMLNRGFDALILRTRANFCWITDGHHNHIETSSPLGVSDFLILRDELVLVTTKVEAPRIVEEELRDLPCRIIAVDWTDSPKAALCAALSAYSHIASDTAFDTAQVVESDLRRLRKRLTPHQVDQYMETCQLAGSAMAAAAHRLQRGMTEFEAAAVLTQEALIRGLNASVVLVSSDERIQQYRHPLPTMKPILRMVMLVMCAEKYGLYANLTRFVAFDSVDATFSDRHAKCSYIDAAMGRATRPGRTVGSVVERAMVAYREVGYPDDWQYLHLGGPTGYATREWFATARDTDIIAPSECYTWNPTLPGIKSEDTLLVREEENCYLTETENWPMMEVRIDGDIVYRPAILQK